MELYEAPELIELGSVAEMTEEATSGLELDQDFPAGTPFGDLTFTANI